MSEAREIQGSCDWRLEVDTGNTPAGQKSRQVSRRVGKDGSWKPWRPSVGLCHTVDFSPL